MIMKFKIQRFKKLYGVDNVNVEVLVVVDEIKIWAVYNIRFRNTKLAF